MQPQSSATSLETFWALGVKSIYASLQSSDKGLSDEDASERLKNYGPNTLKSSSKASGLLLFLLQFKSPLTLLLIIAAGLSLGLGDKTDAIIIFVIILVSSVLGFWQEKGAANAVAKLLQMVQIKCRVLRNRNEMEIPVEKVVPGDIAILTAGDIIPGDSLIIESQELYADEAAFTGETFPVEKNTGIVKADASLAQRSNTLYMGAHVISGTAKVVIVKTGKQTEFGKISNRLLSKPPETDFEKGIRHFGYMLMEITLILVVIIFGVNVFLHKPVLDSFLFSLALAVGLTPQLLPVIITINLSKGAANMAKLKVIVKRLSSIENFGSMNILCSDKTGTITDGKVNVKEASGIDGNISEKTMQYAWLNASVQKGFRNPIDEAICNSYNGIKTTGIVQAEIPYDFIRKRLTVQLKVKDTMTAITKGAFKNILEVCSFAENSKGQVVSLELIRPGIIKQYEQLSKNGYRTLGVAYKNTDEKDFVRQDETGMIFLGFLSLYDPPKKEAQQTIENLRKAGVSLKIITGDNALVANSLAKQVGLMDAIIITGSEIRQMSEAAFMHQAQTAHIFAEVEPNQKERIILAFKKAGNVVGFMGDGINDAPALHAADVGISVDSAVDVAKEAADIVLLDQDLQVLEAGILEGRKTFANTMKYIFMATSANFGNMFSMAGASLFLPFLPLLPKQILMTNLLTDFPEMAIASDRVDDISVATPHKWDIGFIKKFMIVFGLISSVFDYLTFGVLIYFLKADEHLFQTGWFLESVISATLIVLVVRTRLSFVKSLPGRYLTIATLFVVLFVLIMPFTPFSTLFNFVKLPAPFYGWMALIVTGYIVSAELAKKWFYRKRTTQS
ncbi:MAG: magnesium-translocating P-type ATPase [Rhizobacter sp.]|nr:magnesium-translocating P-type ATPase [Ferruginibacter sp.]